VCLSQSFSFNVRSFLGRDIRRTIHFITGRPSVLSVAMLTGNRNAEGAISMIDLC
jgi:hypothetical protein